MKSTLDIPDMDSFLLIVLDVIKASSLRILNIMVQWLKWASLQTGMSPPLPPILHKNISLLPEGRGW
jgi:hypothetical protein